MNLYVCMCVYVRALCACVCVCARFVIAHRACMSLSIFFLVHLFRLFPALICASVTVVNEP